jgi:hypothetical protein
LSPKSLGDSRPRFAAKPTAALPREHAPGFRLYSAELIRTEEHGMAKSKVTTDHEEIRRWAERHGGKPAAVKSTHREDDPGIIRIMFPNAPHSEHDNLEEISWDEFFEKFDENDLALIYEEDKNFAKLVKRETAESKSH